MATTGLNTFSEESVDYKCTPCSQQENSVEAQRFCVECGEYFCASCLSCHERFGATKGHTLVKCEEVSKENVVTCMNKCERHVDKEEDMVCCDHDVVCCRICISRDHRSCQNIDYLPDLARKYKEDRKREELGRDLNETIEEIKVMHNDLIAQAFKLKMRKTTGLKRLEIFQRSVADLVKTLISKAEIDIENVFGPDIGNIQEQIRTYDAMLSKMHCLSRDMSNETNDIVACRKVLECKHALKEIQIEPCVFDDKSNIAKFQNEIVEFAANRLKDDEMFGNLALVDSGVSFHIPNLYVKDDDSASIVLLADFNNSKIRRFETDLTKADSFDVKGRVWGICEIDRHELAITITETGKVQFLSLGKCPELKECFTTNVRCRGIAYLDNKIYVTCNGMIGEEEGQVNVFDLEGKLLDKYYEDSEGKYFSSPRSIIVNTEGIYITDQQNGVICLDLEGNRKWVCNNKKCKFPFGICFTPKGNLLVSGRDSNNIVTITKDGEFLGEVLNEDDGISRPMALGIYKERNCIIVPESKKPQLKIFYIGDCEL